MDLSQYFTISPNAPTAAQTSNQLSDSSSGLESLLNTAIGAYSAITQAKNQNEADKLAIAKANQTAPLTTGSGFSLTPQMIGIGAAVVGGLVLLVVLTKK